MSVAQLYSDPNLRSTCYCPDGNKNLQVAGKTQKIECRTYNKIGLQYELTATAKMTELWDKRLIDIVAVGVDNVKFTTDNEFDFETQSEGTGGLTKYDCGVDFQAPKVRKHEKIGFVSLVYIHTKECTKNLIGTELQDAAFPNNRYSDSTLYPTAFSDMIIMAARKRFALDINKTDIIGIFKGSDTGATHYDGILAQAYWAYTQNAYFHSVQFEIDENVLVDGTFLHAKYVGAQISIEFDSTQASDASVERYQTYEEVYERLVEWLNDLTTVNGNSRIVDTSLYQNTITVTSKWTADWIQLMLTVSADANIDWTSCARNVGIESTVLQGAMPIDERPFLVKYRPYTVDNILSALPADIHAAVRNMDNSLLKMGQKWALYIDEKTLSDYNYALENRTMAQSQGSVYNTFGRDFVFTLSSLANTGLWFITAVDETGSAPALRNIKHLVDSTGRNATAPSLQVDTHCRNIEMLYEQLHGVLVLDFRLFASNLLCSPFVSKLNQPMEALHQQLPCYNARVREVMGQFNQSNDCNVQARFYKEYEIQNQAYYALPNGAGGFTIHDLQVGETLPVGALPVYQISFKDSTTGIPFDKLASTTYEYTVQFSDGTSATYTSKDFIVTFIGNLAGQSFNVIQKVTVEGCGTSQYVASGDYDENYPFMIEGACADITVDFAGRIQDMKIYEVTSTAFNTAITVTGAPDPTIDLSGNTDANSAANAAAIVNAYFLANNIAGSASGSGTTLVVYSPDVLFVNIDPLGTPVAFTPTFHISMYDSTAYTAHDGLGSIEVFVYCQGDAQPVNPTFTAIPVNQEIDACVGELGWEVRATLTTKLGCEFSLSATVNEAAIVDGVVNFTMTV